MCYTYRSICIGGQLASAKARRGALRLFLALEFLREGQNGFLNNAGILLRVRFVSITAIAAIKSPPPTRAPQARPTDTRSEEFLFFLEYGGFSVR